MYALHQNGKPDIVLCAYCLVCNTIKDVDEDDGACGNFANNMDTCYLSFSSFLTAILIFRESCRRGKGEYAEF